MSRDLQCLRTLGIAIDEYNREESKATYTVPSEIMVKSVENECRAAVYASAAQQFTGKRLLTFAKWLPTRSIEMFVTTLNDRLEMLDGKPGLVAALERGELVMALKVVRYENPAVYDRIDKVLERFPETRASAIQIS